MMILYLFDFPNLNCRIAHMLIRISVLASRLMFLPITINRFINIAFPFSHKRIMNAKTVATVISSLWLFILLVSYISKVDHFELVLAFGECQLKQTSRLTSLVTIGTLIISIVVIATTSI